MKKESGLAALNIDHELFSRHDFSSPTPPGFYADFWGILKLSSRGYWYNFFLILLETYMFYESGTASVEFVQHLLLIQVPNLVLNISLYCFISPYQSPRLPKKYSMKFRLQEGNLKIDNLIRGVSVMGAAGSGKTESVILAFLKHLSNNSFCGIIHDYKNFELTEIAYPLFKKAALPFYIVSFDKIFHRVNPIAPRYMTDEESVNEISRVFLENLLEQKEVYPAGSTKFFNDAVEGLIAGLIWKMKTDYPYCCTLPHLISVYQYLNTESLVSFLSSNKTAKAMASAFIDGTASERQTAAVRSTLANAFKKISTHRIFMALSADEIPLDINHPEHPAVISIVNNPKFEIAYSPAIAALIHTIIKQMSVRKREASFLLLEEAPTIRLLNMHRIPATLRSYGIATIYVMQDKIQNELLYGDKASRAILANLSYQFFGKVNDPDTARYYERFFEIVKRQNISISQSEGLSFDTRITKSEKEVSKIRADSFFRLKPGEFVAFADGKEQRIKFRLPDIEKSMPVRFKAYSEQEVTANFEKVHQEARSIFA